MSAARGPIRVLHLRDSPWVDGPGRTILETAATVDRSRIDLHLGILVEGETIDHPLEAAARKRGLPVHRIADSRGLSSTLSHRIRTLTDQLQIDILHTSDIRTNLHAALTGLPPRVRRVATAHGWIANSMRRKVLRVADMLMFRRLDLVIFVSAATSGLVPTWWLPASRRATLPNALPDAWFEPNTDTTDVSAATSTILNVGRLSPEKGQDILLRAIASLKMRFPAIRLRIAGTGPSEPQLRELAQKLGIADRVEFLGHVSDMRSLYAASDVLVQSSCTEGMPNAVLEAAAVGLPVVATDVGGTREIIAHGKTGWLIAGCGADSVAAGIMAFLVNPEKFRAMAQRASCEVRANHSMLRRTEGLMCLYERLMEKAT